MRITILQGAFLPVPPLRGGAVEKMWFRLGQEFANRGNVVTHVSARWGNLPTTERIAGVEHVRVAGFDRPQNRLLQLTRDWIFTRRALRSAPESDLIVTNTFWAPLLACRRTGAIYVDVQRMPRGQMRFYRKAARLRATSTAVAKAIVAEAPVLGTRVKVIPNPLPFDADHPIDFGAKTKTILYAGRVHPEKGIELLLATWRRARDCGRLNDWSLEIVGPHAVAEGGGGAGWFERLRQHNPDVRWRPACYDQAKLIESYNRCAVFVYPSLAERGETFGVAVLEAMACGAIPVVSSLDCFKDFVAANESGIVFDHRCDQPVVALLQALELATERANHGMGARVTWVRKTHAPGAIAEQFLQDFRSVIRR